MELLTVKGIVLTQRQVGEYDKFIDILTEDQGVLEVLVKGSGKITSKSGSAAQLFAYSAFCLRKGKRGYLLNSVSPLRIFYGLRNSLTAVALASYFSQLLRFSVLPKSGTPEILALFLNCLHFLEHRKYPESFLKSIFELRLASLLGFMPDVIMCRSCGCYLPEKLYFSVEDGCFFCKECRTVHEGQPMGILMPDSVLLAIRHIVLREPDRIFGFRLSADSQQILNRFAEQFLLYHTDFHVPALEYYKKLTGFSE